jgi:hypothetical protein
MLKNEQGQGQRHKNVTLKVFLDPSGEISSRSRKREQREFWLKKPALTAN